MCGIFGVVVGRPSEVNRADLKRLVRRMFLLSEERGREAAGLCIRVGGEIRVFKRAMRAREMLKHPAYRAFWNSALDLWRPGEPIAIFGHSRLVTNGTQGIDDNNQPVASEHMIGVHNGIICNDAALWRANPDLRRNFVVDTEVLYQLIDKEYAGGASLPRAVARVYGEIEGEASIAFFHDSENVLGLATNVGSLYWSAPQSAKAFLFASERYFLDRLIDYGAPNSPQLQWSIRHLAPLTGLIVDLDACALRAFSFSDAKSIAEIERRPSPRASITDQSPRRAKLVRCTRCVLPHTFPFISFDAQGVCNFCREHQPVKRDRRIELEKILEPIRSKDGSPDCILALSGGRDSCYGLHIVKTELGMNPIAYTYDWAMVTDEARRNCAKVCGALNVEHIIRSADILKKRRNIRSNIDAWLHRPELGMIPLFMAGDKQFFHYASKVQKENRLPLTIFCGGNDLELTRFKSGFCGVRDRTSDAMLGASTLGKVQMLAYYAKNYFLNPRYLNRSVFDTLFAFYTTYLQRGDFIYLYKYYPWDEGRMSETLAQNYGWESASDSASTWRIGDGTASFYNYIYHTVAGFSEHDTFRSNQIRAGMITRDEALSLIAQDNTPRYESMTSYAQLVGFNLDEALSIINNIPKLQ